MVPQGSLLGLALFNVFVGDIESRIEGTFSKFADDTALCGAADPVEGRHGIQKDLDRLQRWPLVNPMESSEAKCKVLHMDWGSTRHKQTQAGQKQLRAALR